MLTVIRILIMENLESGNYSNLNGSRINTLSQPYSSLHYSNLMLTLANDSSWSDVWGCKV